MKKRLSRLFAFLIIIFFATGFVMSLNTCQVFADSSDTTNNQVIFAGGNQFFILMKDGTVKACGLNNGMQLGVGDNSNRSVLVTISGLTGVKQLSTGYDFALALMNDGTVKAWGNSVSGQLGTGNTSTQGLPVNVPGLSGVKQLVSGTSYSLALMNDGTVKAWGDNSYGQLGLGDNTKRLSPVTISGLSNVKQLSAGDNHSLALLNDGTIAVWGNNGSGQLGIGDTTNRSIPVFSSNISGVKQVVAGNCHTLALLNDGTVKAWGDNGRGELGIGNNTSQITPVKVSGLSCVKILSAASMSSYAVMNDGTVKAWGYNYFGQLGIGNTTDQNSPVIIPGLISVLQMSSGINFSIAILNDGSLTSWGYNCYGQLGIGNTINQNFPAKIQGIIPENPPRIISSYPTDKTSFSQTNSKFTPQTQISDADNNSLICKYYIDNQTNPEETKVVNGTNLSQDVYFSEYDTGTLSEGSHTIRFEISDSNVTVPNTVNFTVDKSNPIINNFDLSSTVSSITSSATANDSVSGMDAFRFSIDGSSSDWIRTNNKYINSNVVNLTANIGGNSGRKLTRLDNGWLVCSIYYSNTIYLYKSSDGGFSWDQLCMIFSFKPYLSNAYALASTGNKVTVLAEYADGTTVKSYTFDATTQTNINIESLGKMVDYGQSNLDSNCSIAIGSDGVIHAAWSSRNSIYFYSYNIRYSKSLDGGNTWNVPTQITAASVTNQIYWYVDPCIVIKNDNTPIIFMELSTNSASNYIISCSWTGTNWSYGSLCPSASYLQSAINAVVDNKGIIHVVWQGIDNTSWNSIRYTKSEDGGKTWSSAIRLADGNLADQQNPSITFDKDNKLYVIFQGRSNSQYEQIRMIAYDGLSWGSITDLTANSTASAQYPQTCSNFNNFSDPLYFYLDNQRGSLKYTGIINENYSYEFNNLLPNKQYTIKLEAKDKAGNVSFVTKDIYTKAETPVINSKSITPTSIELSTDDKNPKDTLYQISMGDMYISSSGELTSNPSWITLTDKKIIVHGLSPSGKYLFQAKARNYEGVETEYSNIASCNTFKGVPEVPDNTKIISAEDKITITWNAVEDSTGYEIEVDGTIIDNGTSTTYEGDFEPGTNHTFRVRARNEVGAGDWSSVLEGTAKYGLPTAPANLTTAPAGTSINVSWDAVAGATGYDLEIDGQVKNVGLKTSYTNTGLKPATQHTYKVRSRNVQGPGEWSSLETVMTTGGTPGKPSNFTYTVTDTTATINWDAATDAETYDIVEVVNGQDGRVVDNGSPTTCEKRGLAPSSTHTYKIRAVNSIGAGEWSDPFTITTFLLDTPSDIVTIESDTSIFLGWSAVKNATSYVISINGTETTTTSNVFTFSKLTPETKYTFKVKAVGANGESSYSDPITTVTTPIKPAVPKNVSATISDTLITVTWDKVESAEGYDVELDGIVMEDDDDNIYIHDGLESDTMHTYRARARNSAIEGDWSDMQYIKTLPGKPVVPKNIEIRSTTTGATLTWQGKDSDLSYDIKIYDGSKKEDGTPADPVIIENIAKKTYTHRRTALGQEYTYWIRTRNKEGVSDWSGKIINNAIKAKCTKNKTVDLGLTAKDVTDFSAYTMVVTYNASAVDVIDLSTLTGNYETTPGKIEGTDIEITDFTPGKITFKCDKVVDPGEAWTGVINSIKFRAKATGGTTITYTVFCKLLDR